MKAIDDYYEIDCRNLNFDEILKVDRLKIILFKNADHLDEEAFKRILNLNRKIVVEITSDKFKRLVTDKSYENVVFDFLVNDYVLEKFDFSQIKAKKQAHVYLIKENLPRLMDYVKFLAENNFYQVRFIYPLPYFDIVEIPKITEIQNPLKEVLLFIINKTSMYGYLENMPYCVLPYFEKYFQRYDLSLKSSKAGICENCALSEICYGFYDKYFENFSDFVFTPIYGRKRLSFSELIRDENPFFDNPKIYGKLIDDPFSRKV